jgi:hypothetical protein
MRLFGCVCFVSAVLFAASEFQYLLPPAVSHSRLRLVVLVILAVFSLWLLLVTEKQDSK